MKRFQHNNYTRSLRKRRCFTIRPGTH